MACQAESGHIRHGVDPLDVTERRARLVEAHHIGGSCLEVDFGHHPLLLGGGHHAHAEGLGEVELVARLGTAVPLQVLDGHAPGDGQTKNGLRGIDAVAAGERNARFGADGASAFQYLPCHLRVELVHRPTENGDRHQRGAAHGVDVADGIGRGNAPEGVRVVDDGHEEVRGGHGRRAVPEVIDGRVVPRAMAHEQPRVVGLGTELSKNAVEHTRGNLAAAAGSMAELRQPDGVLLHGRKFAHGPQAMASGRGKSNKPFRSGSGEAVKPHSMSRPTTSGREKSMLLASGLPQS